MRLRALVLDRMRQLDAQAGGSEARLVLLWRQLADKLTKMKPARSAAQVKLMIAANCQMRKCKT